MAEWKAWLIALLVTMGIIKATKKKKDNEPK